MENARQNVTYYLIYYIDSENNLVPLWWCFIGRLNGLWQWYSLPSPVLFYPMSRSQYRSRRATHSSVPKLSAHPVRRSPRFTPYARPPSDSRESGSYSQGAVPSPAMAEPDLWNLITGPEAFMGMAEVVRDVAVQLSSQHGDLAGLDKYIVNGLVKALVQKRYIKPEFVKAFSALKEEICKWFHHALIIY